MLRRLVRNDDIGPLRTLVSVIEPVKEYRRYQMRPQTMLSPLTGVIKRGFSGQRNRAQVRVYGERVSK